MGDEEIKGGIFLSFDVRLILLKFLYIALFMFFIKDKSFSMELLDKLLFNFELNLVVELLSKPI